jgi:hypothetical protein
MPSESSPESRVAPSRGATSPAWLHARELWAGLSIIFMWLAVLFVGIFGGDLVASSSGGFTKLPVVVFLLPFVLPATIVVGRRGFTSAPVERQGGAEEETRAHEEPRAQSPGVRAKAA